MATVGVKGLYLLTYLLISLTMLQELARHVRPNTIRALFGRTKAKNAIHCTDLPEDAELEVEYFFKILDR